MNEHELKILYAILEKVKYTHRLSARRDIEKLVNKVLKRKTCEARKLLEFD
jgi:hypothetical protein